MIFYKGKKDHAAGLDVLIVTKLPKNFLSIAYKKKKLTFRLAKVFYNPFLKDKSVFFISIAIVIGPTPPGTGVM